MAQLALSNVVNISVSQAQPGVGNYSTSNIGLFSDEKPASSFGTNGYQFYVSPTQVGIDFGTASKTYQMALQIFSQQPNILAGGGQLIVILMSHATNQLALSGVPASGTFEVTFKGNNSAAINWNDTAATIQTKLQAVPGLAGVLVSGSLAGEALSIEMAGVYGASPALTITANSLETSGSAAITITPSVTTPGQSLAAAITAAIGVVQFFGVLVDETITDIGQSDMLAAAAVVQANNLIAFFVSYAVADIEPGGSIDLLRTGTLTYNRGLYFGDNSVQSGYTGLNAILYAASYAGRGLSVNFTGSNTTITMNLKSLVNVQPDPSMTQTIYNYAAASGADIYASFQGVAKVVSNGANSFFDQVYNLLWFVGALQVAGFNYLAQAATKIPQTESGMDGLKAAYAAVCVQGVTNQYLAPGTWTSPTTFGNLVNLLANIAQVGYYIFSQPIGQQSQTARAARQAPLVQIAVKQAGAIQSSNVIVNVNA